MTDIKRQEHRQRKQSIEWGRGKSLAAVKQEKNNLARAKITEKAHAMGQDAFSLQLAHAFLLPILVYCYLIVLYSVCKDGLQLLQSAKARFSSSEKNHWTCPLYSALTDFQRTVNIILQCRPYLKALRSELKLSRKINKNSGVKILVNSFAPLAWTELLKTRVSISCGAGLRLWKHKAQGAKHMSLNMCVCAHTHVHILETTHTQFIHYVSVHNHNDNVQIPV